MPCRSREYHTLMGPPAWRFSCSEWRRGTGQPREGPRVCLTLSLLQLLLGTARIITAPSMPSTETSPASFCLWTFALPFLLPTVLFANITERCPAHSEPRETSDLSDSPWLPPQPITNLCFCPCSALTDYCTMNDPLPSSSMREGTVTVLSLQHLGVTTALHDASCPLLSRGSN